MTLLRSDPVGLVSEEMTSFIITFTLSWHPGFCMGFGIQNPCYFAHIPDSIFTSPAFVPYSSTCIIISFTPLLVSLIPYSLSVSPCPYLRGRTTVVSLYPWLNLAQIFYSALFWSLFLLPVLITPFAPSIISHSCILYPSPLLSSVYLHSLGHVRNNIMLSY